MNFHLTVFFTVAHPDLALGSSNASISTPPVNQNKGGVGQAVVLKGAQANAPQPTWPTEAGHMSIWLLDGLLKGVYDVNAACIGRMQ